MKFYSISEINSFVSKFKDCSLPKLEWTHKAHFIVGLYYLFHCKDKALNNIRQDIKKYNLSKGVINDENSGYHETITRFYLWAIRKYILKDFKELTLDMFNKLIEHEITDKNYPYNYYSKELLFSVEARLSLVEPDLQKLD